MMLGLQNPFMINPAQQPMASNPMQMMSILKGLQGMQHGSTVPVSGSTENPPQSTGQVDQGGDIWSALKSGGPLALLAAAIIHQYGGQ